MMFKDANKINEPRLRDLIPNRKMSQLARDVGVSRTAVTRWVKANAIPPRRVFAVANALDVEIVELLPFAQRASLPTSPVEKVEDDLETLLAAYEGRDYTSRLTLKSIKTTLGIWGDKFPLLYQTLKALKAGEITNEQAATKLGVARKTIHGLCRRYGMSPERAEAQPRYNGRYKSTTEMSRKLAIEVIAGRMSARAASKTPGTSLRTLHRHISNILEPLSLNEISHWSSNFRFALAHEIATNSEKHTIEWRKWAESKGLILKKKVVWPKTPKNLREVGFLQLLVLYLNGTMSLDEIAARRGGEAEVLLSRFKIELANRNMDALKLTVHHQAAAAEIIVAEMSNYRSGTVYERNF